jgi:hypothetical protein
MTKFRNALSRGKPYRLTRDCAMPSTPRPTVDALVLSLALRATFQNLPTLLRIGSAPPRNLAQGPETADAGIRPVVKATTAHTGGRWQCRVQAVRTYHGN